MQSGFSNKDNIAIFLSEPNNSFLESIIITTSSTYKVITSIKDNISYYMNSTKNEAKDDIWNKMNKF